MNLRGILLVAAAVASVARQQQPPRDPAAAAPSARGSIAGIVVSEDRDARPLYRALVTLSGPGLDSPRTVVTNTDGRFQFGGLPSARYTLVAFKDGYLRTTFGAPGTRVTGPAVSLGPGGSATVTMRLARSGAITGTVFDQDGLPAPGILVRAISERWRTDSGRRLLESTGPPATTDDRGVYRLYGLSPGDYLVAAEAADPDHSVVQIVSDEEERRVLAELAAARPAPATPSPRSLSAEPRRTVTFAPVYYPGTVAPGRASRVSLAPGDERGGIDLQLQHVATATVRVTAVAPPHVARAASVVLYGPLDMLPRSRITFAMPGQDDRLVFDDVAPGRYTLAARFPLTSADGELLANTVADRSSAWATAELVVSGETFVDVTLTPLPVVTISGRVSYPGAAAPPAPPAERLLIQASHVRRVSGIMAGSLPSIAIDADGRFRMPDIVPGPYRIAAPIPGVRADVNGWWLSAFLVGGRDILDTPLEFGRDASDGVLVLSDRASEIAGKVTDTGGVPATEQTVIVFSAARDSWFANSRRVAGATVGADGRYVIRNLPPGDYWIAPTENVAPGEWFDAVFLERLLPRARRLRVAGQEAQVVDFAVGP